jgi:hypothetical protein
VKIGLISFRPLLFFLPFSIFVLLPLVSFLFRFEIGQYPQILSHFEKNSEQVKSEVRHEQAYLSREIHKLGKLEYWQDEWVPSFKYRCCPSWIKSWFKAPFIPQGAKVIIFHGLPNPPEAINGISKNWILLIIPIYTKVSHCKDPR